MSPRSFSKFLSDHVLSPQSSSLMKTPRYFTKGSSEMKFSPYFTFAFCFTGTSAHQYHGLTPIASEIWKTPYASPLGSEPATSILFPEVFILNDSHLPAIASASSSMDDLPTVPRTTTGPSGLSCVTFGRTPDTLSISSARV